MRLNLFDEFKLSCCVSTIMSSPTDPTLYARVKRNVSKRYGETTSVFRSMAIVKEYVKRGGTYKGKKRPSLTKKWLQEEWIDVLSHLKGLKKNCGEGKRRQHACRPSKRVDRSTPLTIREVIQLHGVNKVKRLATKKSKHTELVRIDWVNGKSVLPSH